MLFVFHGFDRADGRTLGAPAALRRRPGARARRARRRRRAGPARRRQEPPRPRGVARGVVEADDGLTVVRDARAERDPALAQLAAAAASGLPQAGPEARRRPGVALPAPAAS